MLAGARMSSAVNLVILVAMLFVYALINYYAWNAVAPLFTCLPEAWMHLTFMQIFWLHMLWRSVTIIMRSPFHVVPERLKKDA